MAVEVDVNLSETQLQTGFLGHTRDSEVADSPGAGADPRARQTQGPSCGVLASALRTRWVEPSPGWCPSPSCPGAGSSSGYLGGSACSREETEPEATARGLQALLWPLGAGAGLLPAAVLPTGLVHLWGSPPLGAGGGPSPASCPATTLCAPGPHGQPRASWGPATQGAAAGGPCLAVRADSVDRSAPAVPGSQEPLQPRLP